MTSTPSNYFQRPHFLTLQHWRVRASPYEFWGNTNIPFITGTQKVAASGQREAKCEPSVIFSQRDKTTEQEVSREMEISTHGFVGKSPPMVPAGFLGSPDATGNEGCSAGPH